MPRRCLGFALLGIAVALAGCGSSSGQESPGKTQPGAAPAQEKRTDAGGGCDAVPSADELRRLLVEAPGQGEAGGLFHGRKEWAAVVDRSGRLCAVVVSTDDPEAAWPGSQAIAKAKAYTANAFSTDDMPLSTARLYTLAQPGHSLFGAAAANPFDAKCLATPGDHDDSDERLCGGTIVFGGGVALYRGKKKVGGLGASGDTACADHEIAKRIRDKAGLNPPDGTGADDIVYTSADGPSLFAHPLCKNTWRNQQQLGDEPPASGY